VSSLFSWTLLGYGVTDARRFWCIALDETVSRLGPGAGAGPLRDALRKNNNVRLKHAINYGRVEATIAMFQDVLMDLKNVLVELAAVPSFGDQNYEGVIHGDFWCGK